jgi:hypothetical protein
MIDMLRRMLMSAEAVLDDTVVDVDVSPVVFGMMGRLYKAQGKKRHADFVIHLKDGALKTNRLFACTLFDVIATKLESDLVSEPHKAFYIMDDVCLHELKALIGLVCGQTKQMQQEEMLRLLSIGRQYLIPEFLINLLVSDSLQLLLETIAELKREENEMATVLVDQYAPPTPLPKWFGHSKNPLNEAEIAAVKMGQHFCLLEKSAVSPFDVIAWHGATVISEVQGRDAFIRYFDEDLAKTVAKKMDIGSLHLILNFDGVTPKTVYPANRFIDDVFYRQIEIVQEYIQFDEVDVHINADKVGHFCVREVPEDDGDSNIVLFLGVCDKHSIFALKDGNLVNVKATYWKIVDSIDLRYVEPNDIQYTQLIVNAVPLRSHDFSPRPTELRGGELRLGAYYGCIVDGGGTLLEERIPVLLLAIEEGEEGEEYVRLLTCNHSPSIYTAPLRCLYDLYDD